MMTSSSWGLTSNRLDLAAEPKALCFSMSLRGITAWQRCGSSRPLCVRALSRFAFICAFYPLASNWAVGQPPSLEPPKIVLPEFRLLDLGITTRWEANKSGIITRVIVTEVLKRSAAWEPGLRIGDELQAINHRQVAGMQRDDYLAALEAPLTPAKPQIFTFSMSRGFIIVRTGTFDLMVQLEPRKMSAPNRPKASTP
jgi:membrane-associated protease RseP (regulator of RpoE activity)